LNLIAKIEEVEKMNIPDEVKREIRLELMLKNIKQIVKEQKERENLK
jgi:hypothetical protein